MSLLREPGLRNRRAIPFAAIAVEPVERFGQSVTDAVAGGWRIASLFGTPEESGRTRLVAILADDAQGELGVTSAVVGDRYPALTPACPQAHAFERELA